MMYYLTDILDYLVCLYMSLVQDINNRMFGIMAYASIIGISKKQIEQKKTSSYWKINPPEKTTLQLLDLSTEEFVCNYWRITLLV